MTEKIKYLKENPSGTYSIIIRRNDYKFRQTFKTKKDALIKLEEVNKDIKILDIKKKDGNPQILVSKENEYLLTKYKWNITKDGYAVSTIDNVTWKLHRYIKIIIQGMDHITSKDYVDHINNIRHDNRDENLRIVSTIENGGNKSKQQNTSSIYMGVSKDGNLFRVGINVSELRLRVSYKNELHAAWQYNLWIDEYKLINYNKNDIEEPKDFIQYVKKDKYPTGITKYKKGFKIKYKKVTKYSKTLKQAKLVIIFLTKKFEENRILEIKSQEIKRNDDGYAIISTQKSKIDIIVDDEDYYELLILGISVVNNYARIGKCRLSRHLLNYTGELKVDHINNNTLDNRKCNLQLATSLQNSQNRSKSKNTSSKYIGVYWDTYNKRWRSSIKINGKTKILGTFVNEEDAAKARDIATIKYFDEGFRNLNFP